MQKWQAYNNGRQCKVTTVVDCETTCKWGNWWHRDNPCKFYSLPRVLASSSCPRPCAQSRPSKLMPHRHRLCHMSSTIVPFHSALINIPSVKIPLSSSPKQSQCQLCLISTKGVCLYACQMYSSCCLWPLTIPISALFSPWLPAIVALRSLSVASCFLFVSPQLLLWSLPHVIPLPSSFLPFILCTNSLLLCSTFLVGLLYVSMFSDSLSCI